MFKSDKKEVINQEVYIIKTRQFGALTQEKVCISQAVHL